MLSKENIEMMRVMLEEGQTEEILFALYDYVYEGKEPEFKTKAMMGAWTTVKATLERTASKYIKGIKAGKANTAQYNATRAEAKKMDNPDKAITDLLHSIAGTNITFDEWYSNNKTTLDAALMKMDKYHDIDWLKQYFNNYFIRHSDIPF